MLVDPTTMQRLRSVTSTVADSQITKNNYRKELPPSPVARIAQVSNTMAQHGQHRPQGPYPTNPGILPPPGLTPAQIQHWAHQNPHTRTVLEHLLGGAPDPTAPSDPLNTTVCINPLTAAATTLIQVSLGLCWWPFAPYLREHPKDLLRALWTDPLRKFISHLWCIFFSFLFTILSSSLSQVKVPPGKSCGFVQFVRKADAERAIEALSGYSIGGSKVRLSWGRSTYLSSILLIPLYLRDRYFSMCRSFLGCSNPRPSRFVCNTTVSSEL